VIDELLMQGRFRGMGKHESKQRAEELLDGLDLEEADAMAERIVVIDNGLVIADDTGANLKATLAGDRITLTVAPADVEKTRRLLADNGTEVAGDGRSISARVDRGPELLPILLRQADAAGLAVLAARLRQPTLDDVFLNLTGRSLREGAEQ
jgi:ABC-2 type transport system ATP-binding protein